MPERLAAASKNSLKRKWDAGKLNFEEKEHIRRLTQIGLVWEADSWKARWELARRYYESNGNLDIPQNFVTEEGSGWESGFTGRDNCIKR